MICYLHYSTKVELRSNDIKLCLELVYDNVSIVSFRVKLRKM